jgi:hypothetical protein
MQTKIKIQPLLLGIVVLAVVYGLFLRLFNFTRPITYDELWGLSAWVPKNILALMTYFEHPNNHPLNSLWMKFANYFFADSLIMLRLHSLLLGLLIPCLTAYIAQLVTRRRFIVGLTLILTLLHSGLIYYSQLARGYNLEIVFLLAFLALLLLYHNHHKSHLNSFSKDVAVTLGMLGCFMLGCFSLPMAILYFVAFITLHTMHLLSTINYHCNFYVSLQKIIKENSVLLCSYALMTIFAFWMYIINYDKFHAALPHGSGEVITSLSSLFYIVGNRIDRLIPGGLLIVALGGLLLPRYRRITIGGILFILPVCIAAVVSKVGPTRVYLPLVPIWIIMIAIGFYAIGIRFCFRKRKLYLTLLPLLLFVYGQWQYQHYYYEWAEECYTNTVRWLEQNCPINKSYHCYPIFSGRKIARRYPAEIQTISNPLRDNMLFTYAGDYLSGLDLNGKARIVKINKKTMFVIIDNYPVCKKNPIYFYNLKQLAKYHKKFSNLLLVNIKADTFENLQKKVTFLYSNTPQSNWVVLNVWLNPPVTISDKAYYNYILATDNGSLLTTNLLALEKAYAPDFTFYTLQTFSSYANFEQALEAPIPPIADKLQRSLVKKYGDLSKYLPDVWEDILQ